MSKRRILRTATALLALCALALPAACAGGRGDAFVQKPITGIDAMFDESLGYYNEHASVLEENGERYVYYTKNQTKNDDGREYIAVRKGTQRNGEWTYTNASVALQPAKSGWDGEKVFQSDVVKGDFTYHGAAYSYLMAYAGTQSDTSRKGAQIGLAVAKTPTGPFERVNDTPFLTWNAYDYSQYGETVTNGVCEPSLINYNGGGQIILFYSLFNPNTSHSCKYVLLDASADLKDLPARSGERGNLLSKEGIADMGTDPACIGADFALSADKTTLYAVRDYYPVPAVAPAVAEAVQLIGAPVDILWQTVGEQSPRWTVLDDKISSLDTAVWEEENKTGYDRVYSACIIASEYGYVQSGAPLSIAFTSCALASSFADYKFTPMLHEYTVARGHV